MGDGNNIVHSWLQLASKLPMHFVCCGPEGFEPETKTVEMVENTGISTFETSHNTASVAYKAIEHSKANNINTLLIDTAGRLQNKKNLMDEYKKIGNVLKKYDQNAPHEVILVLDATSGQNIINQVEEFNKIISLTGIIMTKLDGTAKGGILIALSKKYKLPIIGLGLGEKVEDFEIFNAEKFADAFIQKD